MDVLPAQQIKEREVDELQTYVWAYQAQPYDRPEIKAAVSSFSVRGANLFGNQEFEVVALFRKSDGELERKIVKIVVQPCSELFKIEDTHVKFSQLRYVTTKVESISNTDEVILVSYRCEDGPRNLYIHGENPIVAVQVINIFRRILYDVYSQYESGETMLDYFAPAHICWLDINISKGEQSNPERKRCIVAVDQECFCLYSGPCQETPDYVVYFYKEEAENVVEKVSFCRKEKVLSVETSETKFHIETQQLGALPLVNALKQIKPKPKDVFHNPCSACAYVRHELKPAAMMFHAPDDVQQPLWTLENTSAQEDTYFHETDIALSESSKLHLKTFKDALENADQRAKDMPDFLSWWQMPENEIIKLIENGCVPETDARSGGLDPNSLDHFKRMVEDIEDKLLEQDFPKALSALQVCRTVFAESRFHEMTVILGDDDITLLRKIYYRALLTQA